MVYTFKFWFEEADDVVRTLIIKPGHTFAQLHEVLQAAVGFDKSYAGKFYVSDDKWRKKQCVSNEPEENYLGKLADIKVSAGVSEPFQKLIYVADEANDWVMHAEMIGISAETNNDEMPKVIKQIGNAPRQRPSAPITANSSSDMDDITAILLKTKQTAMRAKDMGDDDEPDAEELNGIEDEFADETEEDAEEEMGESMFDEEFGTDEEDLEDFGEVEEGGED